MRIAAGVVTTFVLSLAASSSLSQNGALIAIVVVTVIVLLYCVINGTKILNVFNPEGEGVVLSSYSPGGAASVSSDMKTGLTGGTDVVTSAPTGKIERLAVDDNSSGAIESGQGLGLVGARYCDFLVIRVQWWLLSKGMNIEKFAAV